MSVYFAADLHLGHKNIHKYRPEYETPELHDQAILDMLNDSVTKRGIYYLLGDVAFTQEAISSLSKVNAYGNIRIILGNHDIERGVKVEDWVNAGFKDIYSLKKYKEFWLSHAPLHPDELRGKINIHGHTHNKSMQDSRYVCVSLEQTNYKLLSLWEIRNNITKSVW